MKVSQALSAEWSHLYRD